MVCSAAAAAVVPAALLRPFNALSTGRSFRKTAEVAASRSLPARPIRGKSPSTLSQQFNWLNDKSEKKSKIPLTPPSPSRPPSLPRDPEKSFKASGRKQHQRWTEFKSVNKKWIDEWITVRLELELNSGP